MESKANNINPLTATNEQAVKSHNIQMGMWKTFYEVLSGETQETKDKLAKKIVSALQSSREDGYQTAKYIHGET